MRVLLAGSTGAIGRRLVPALRSAGHDVVGLTRDQRKADKLDAQGAQPVVADALDREALLRSCRGLRVDAVIHEMTALSTPPAQHRGMRPTNQLRTRGTANLLQVAHHAGAQRFLTQSIVLGYGYVDHGETIITESEPFGRPDSGAANPHVESMLTNESLVTQDGGLVGVALRYGLFYGGDDDATRSMLAQRKVPVPAAEKLLSWVHIDDAVSATVAALDAPRPAAAYNIVDDQAASWRAMMTATAEAIGAPRPRTYPGWLIRLAAPYVASMILDTSMRVSNARARDELGWAPQFPTFRDGVRVVAVH